MWLAPDPSQALSLGVRLCAAAQLIGLCELALVRDQLAPGGFLDWSMIGILSPTSRTQVGRRIRRGFRRIGPRAFAALAGLDALVAAGLLMRPSATGLIVTACALQVMLIKRHHMTIDGSDQMMLVVLVACALGRIGGDPTSVRAAVSFLAAELTLAYVVAGVSKAASEHWRSGNAFGVIAQTRMYGQPASARIVRGHPWVGRAAGYATLGWETLFLVSLTAPRGVVVGILAVGLGFHLGCALVMGLNRFLWVFAASYPSLLCTNLAIRGLVGGRAADLIAIGSAAAGCAGIAALFGWLPAMPRAGRGRSWARHEPAPAHPKPLETRPG
jgi:hypothetical protein